MVGWDFKDKIIYARKIQDIISSIYLALEKEVHITNVYESNKLLIIRFIR